MPTKIRRESERQRALEAEDTERKLDAIFDHPPAHVKDWPCANINPNDSAASCPEALLRLKRGLISGDEWGNIFHNGAAFGSKANERRKRDARQTAAWLKIKYEKEWQLRGGAKAIAFAETKANRPIHVDTVRRYIKTDKLKPTGQ